MTFKAHYLISLTLCREHLVLCLSSTLIIPCCCIWAKWLTDLNTSTAHQNMPSPISSVGFLVFLPFKDIRNAYSLGISLMGDIHTFYSLLDLFSCAFLSIVGNYLLCTIWPHQPGRCNDFTSSSTAETTLGCCKWKRALNSGLAPF